MLNFNEGQRVRLFGNKGLIGVDLAIDWDFHVNIRPPLEHLTVPIVKYSLAWIISVSVSEADLGFNTR